MDLQELIEQASRASQGARDREQTEPIKGLLLLSQSSTSSFEASLYEPVLCLILQGRKEVSIAGQTLSFGPGECLLVSNDLPVRSRITRAPYVAVVFKVDVASLRKLYEEVAESAGYSALDSEHAQAAATQLADPGLLDAFCRYLALAGSPADASGPAIGGVNPAAGAIASLNAKVLGPLIYKEIHYRLLVAPSGGMLRSLIRHDSNASAIARAITYIRAELHLPIAIPELARRVGMSGSSFHKHFKLITSATPLQYQKELRLLEARRLLRAGGTSVATVAFDVGYESPSQFSREYARKFGVPPSQQAVSGPRQQHDSA